MTTYRPDYRYRPQSRETVMWDKWTNRWIEVWPPAIWATFWITLLFGFFGIIPAAIHSNRAMQMKQPYGLYWITYVIVLATWLLVVYLFGLYQLT